MFLITQTLSFQWTEQLEKGHEQTDSEVGLEVRPPLSSAAVRCSGMVVAALAPTAPYATLQQHHIIATYVRMLKILCNCKVLTKLA